MTPSVTVIIPSRDCLPYLPTALAGIKAQARSDVEAIVIDDGSIDGTGSWLEAQQDKLPWMQVLKTDGIGPNETRNMAIRQSTAPLVAFLDADDIWMPGKIASQIAYHFENPRVVFSFTDYLHVDPAGRAIGRCYEYWPNFARLSAGSEGYRELEQPLAALLAENVVGTSTVMARRDALVDLGGFDSGLRSASDWDLWLRLAASGRVGFSNACTTRYLMRPGSISSNMGLRLDSMRQIVDRHRAAATRQNPAAVRLAEARILTGRAELARAQGHRLNALGYHLAAFVKAPSRRAGRAALADAVGPVTGVFSGPSRSRAA